MAVQSVVARLAERERKLVRRLREAVPVGAEEGSVLRQVVIGPSCDRVLIGQPSERPADWALSPRECHQSSTSRRRGAPAASLLSVPGVVERHREPGRVGQVGVQPDPCEPAHPQGGDTPPALQAAELPLHGGAGPVQLPPTVRVTRDERVQPVSLDPPGGGLALARQAPPLGSAPAWRPSQRTPTGRARRSAAVLPGPHDGRLAERDDRAGYGGTRTRRTSGQRRSFCRHHSGNVDPAGGRAAPGRLEPQRPWLSEPAMRPAGRSSQTATCSL